ncbi:hypothetical protein DSM110093_02815 [Sulfitobacter sp. DSM 110093]|uniref:hypothetical protein n=1 Tax=Sulfitobacter sp. DSM 110093 TaxID=2883127 RepID=UPI001FAC58CA|nr:hypothetical protein [Sulfitobacter sp. DSM 110093]UOA33005.1 hypothetical protein DSM110093_02815 [Sulfitobacter sp. DSM 110093]
MTTMHELNEHRHGYEILAIDGTGAWFVNVEELPTFEAETGIKASDLPRLATAEGTVRFSGREWTVDFLLPPPSDLGYTEYPRFSTN